MEKFEKPRTIPCFSRKPNTISWQWRAIDRPCNVYQRAEASRFSHLCRSRIRARNTTKIVPLSRPWGDDARVPRATTSGVSLEICTDRQVSWWPLAARSPAPTFTRKEIISPYSSPPKLPITNALFTDCQVRVFSVRRWMCHRGRILVDEWRTLQL